MDVLACTLSGRKRDLKEHKGGGQRTKIGEGFLKKKSPSEGR